MRQDKSRRVAYYDHGYEDVVHVVFRYNNRVQVFDASGRFIRTFGGDGRSDGKFQCPWGLTTDSLGFIYVCDKENHRVQVG